MFNKKLKILSLAISGSFLTFDAGHATEQRQEIHQEIIQNILNAESNPLEESPLLKLQRQQAEEDDKKASTDEEPEEESKAPPETIEDIKRLKFNDRYQGGPSGIKGLLKVKK